MRRIMVAFLALCVGIFVVLFLGGLASAALEIRGEKRRGVPVTRPGRGQPLFPRRTPRHVLGPRAAYLRGLLYARRDRKAARANRDAFNARLAATPPSHCQPCWMDGITSLRIMDDRPTGAVVVCAEDLNGNEAAEASHDLWDGSTWADRHESDPAPWVAAAEAAP